MRSVVIEDEEKRQPILLPRCVSPDLRSISSADGAEGLHYALERLIYDAIIILDVMLLGWMVTGTEGTSRQTDVGADVSVSGIGRRTGQRLRLGADAVIISKPFSLY